jgi:DNA helicase II / ATP-dependent DNA helicase PcrA
VRSGRGDGNATVIVAHDDEQREAAGIASLIGRADASLVRANRVAVLARTNAQLPPIAAALAAAGVPVRRLVHGDGSVLGATLQRVFRLGSADDVRQFAQDALEHTDPDLPDDQLEPEQEVGRAILAFLRAQPTGTGPAFRAWCEATDPFGRATSGVELLTFHGAKGREWHTVHLAGCETSLVPHRSATTSAAKAEEARLLYVAATRATDELLVHWARRRGGYQRKLTPLLDGFESAVPEPVPVPNGVTLPVRPAREVTLDRLRAWRDGAARQGGVLPGQLCTDAARAAIADHRPESAEALDAVTGLGLLTSRRLFDGVRDALA